jgi:hypothetical protein
VSKPGSERQRSHVFSHMWKRDAIPVQTVLWKTGHASGKSLTGEIGWKKKLKKVNMGDILSIQEWI